jgi:hypothetical protein
MSFASAYLHDLTLKVTAFPSWEAMKHSMLNDGYVPSLNLGDENAVRLGTVLEFLDYRVFWIGQPKMSEASEIVAATLGLWQRGRDWVRVAHTRPGFVELRNSAGECGEFSENEWLERYDGLRDKGWTKASEQALASYGILGPCSETDTFGL